MTATAVRIPAWRIHVAALTETLFGPDHAGADPTWSEQLRQMRAADEQARVEGHRAAGRAALALTDTPYQLVDVPHLGVLPIGPQEPARIYEAMRGAR